MSWVPESSRFHRSVNGHLNRCLVSSCMYSKTYISKIRMIIIQVPTTVLFFHETLSHYPKKRSSTNTIPDHGKTPTHLMILPPHIHKHTIHSFKLPSESPPPSLKISRAQNGSTNQRWRRADDFIIGSDEVCLSCSIMEMSALAWQRENAWSWSQNNSSLPTRRPLYVICIHLPDTTKTDYILINIFISFQIQIVRLRFISMTFNYIINTFRWNHSPRIPVCVTSVKISIHI